MTPPSTGQIIDGVALSRQLRSEVATRAARLSRPRLARLHHAVRDVLTRAVAKGGSTLRDFSNTQGESGYFQLEAMVYARAAQPCKVCATPIRSIRQGQRATFFCPLCQKA
jgi:formamidopyrimidine-DNA glycosylase